MGRERIGADTRGFKAMCHHYVDDVAVPMIFCEWSGAMHSLGLHLRQGRGKVVENEKKERH